MRANATGCHYCGTTDRELRPYGPSGALVCFRCAMESPDRVAATGRAFEQYLHGDVLLPGDGPPIPLGRKFEGQV